MATKYYAIPFKGWVEIRVAEKQPKLKTTVVLKKIKLPVYGPYTLRLNSAGRETWERNIIRTEEETIRIQSAYHEGGHVVGCVKKRDFEDAMHLTIGKRLHAIRVPKAEAESILTLFGSKVPVGVPSAGSA